MATALKLAARTFGFARLLYRNRSAQQGLKRERGPAIGIGGFKKTLRRMVAQ